MAIFSIAFDWMHRCGKWTQIELLTDKLNNLWKYNIKIRWEYYREWNWENILTDPYSVRWQNNKLWNNYDKKSNILNRELFYFYTKYFPNYLKWINKNNWIIIMDRSIIWRYLFKAWENEDNNWLEKFTYWKHEKYIQDVIIPDIIFILQPSQKELLSRLRKNKNTSGDEKIRYEYKNKYITEKYDDYYNWIKNIPENISKNVIHILWDNTQKENHEYIRSIIKKKCENNFFEPDINCKKANI